MRLRRSKGYDSYYYIYNGSKLSQMSVGRDTLNFSYDANGVPVSVYDVDKGKRYGYVTNIQGDVIAILDEDGNPVVNYTYDAWGNILSITGSEANGIGRLNKKPV